MTTASTPAPGRRPRLLIAVTLLAVIAALLVLAVSTTPSSPAPHVITPGPPGSPTTVDGTAPEV